MRQLHAEDRRLDRVEPAVDADHLVVVPRLHAVDAEQFQRLRDVVAGGREEAAVAGAAEVLGRIEAEAADVTEAAGAAAMPGREDRLGGILDDGHAGPAGDGQQGVHVGRPAEEVHRDDRLAAAADLPLDVGRVDEVGRRVDVGEDRHRPEAGHGAGRGEERVGGQHDLVAGADAEGHQGQQERVAAGGAGDGVWHVEGLRQLRLEFVHVRAEHEAAGVDDPVDRRADLVPQDGVLAVERQERHGRQQVVPSRGFRSRSGAGGRGVTDHRVGDSWSCCCRSWSGSNTVDAARPSGFVIVMPQPFAGEECRGSRPAAGGGRRAAAGR
jgi:hypothetical protein